jgi:hypothetical protein
MNANSQIKWNPITLLFNPFFYIAGMEALGIGLAGILVAGWVGALSHTHFDGVLDTHTGAHAPLAVFLSEGLIDWLCLALVLLLLGKIISKTAFRTIDLLATQALARWPSILISLVTLPPALERFGQTVLKQVTQPGAKIEFNTPDAVIFFAALIVMIAMTCWMVSLMYKSYSVSCNVKGGKAIGTFIVGIVLAEILSKLAIYRLLRLG